MGAASAATFSNASVTLAAGSNALTVTNTIVSLGSPNLRSIIGGSSGALLAGARTTILVNFINDGPVSAINAVYTVRLPAGLAGVQVSNAGLYDAATGDVTWPVVPLMGVGQVDFTISIVVPAGTFALRSTISSENELSTTLADNPSTRSFAPDAPIQSVPTLSNLALLMLSLMLVSYAASTQRRRGRE